MGKIRTLLALVATGLTTVALPAAARAQVPPGAGRRDVPGVGVEQFERRLEQIRRETALQVDPNVPPERRALFDYGGYATFNYLSLDDPYEENHVLRQYDVVGYARLNLDGAHELFARARATFRDFHRGDAFDEEGDSDSRVLVERAYYRFDRQRALAAYDGVTTPDNLVVQGGRQLAYWANGLTLSVPVDGVAVGVTRGALDAQVLAGVTPFTTIDFDSSRPQFDDDTLRGFYGAMVSLRVGPSQEHRPFLYALAQQDYNNDEVRLTGDIVTRFEYESYYVGAGSTGTIGDRLVYGVELVYEGGRGLSNSFTTQGGSLVPVDQATEDITAFAADVRLEYLLPDTRRTRLTGEVIFATGDDDRLHTSNTFGGNAPGTDDRAFNAFGLVNNGLAFAPNVSNLIVLRAGASTFPLPEYRPMRNLQVGADLFLFGKADENAPIDEPTASGRYLGFEPDLFLNWQIRSDITLALRYGIFFGNSDTIVGDDVRQFFYGGLTFAF